MARRIVEASDYGFRKVIRVVRDDSIPQYIHPLDAGQPHEPGLARGPDLPDGSRGPIDRNLAMATECHACVQNWEVDEFIFEKEALLLTDQEMLDQITAQMDRRAAVPVDLVDLNNQPV